MFRMTGRPCSIEISRWYFRLQIQVSILQKISRKIGNFEEGKKKATPFNSARVSCIQPVRKIERQHFKALDDTLSKNALQSQKYFFFKKS